MSIFPLTFGDVSRVLARIHVIPDEKVTAFAARIKNLQRLGLLPEINTGRGRKADYGIAETVLIALAIELLQLGLPPERVITMVNPRRAVVLQELRLAARNGSFIGGSPKLMYFDPRGLADLQDGAALTATGQSLDNVRFGTGKDIGSFFGRHRTKGSPRLAVIDLQKMVTEVLITLEDMLDVDRRTLAEELQQWGFA